MQWHDDPLPKFWSELIGDLRDEVQRLKGATVARSEDQFPMLTPSEDDGTREAMVLSLQAQVREKNAEIAGIRAKFHNVLFLFTIFVLGLVAGKILSQLVGLVAANVNAMYCLVQLLQFKPSCLLYALA